MEKNLKERLLEIELAIKNEEWDKALSLYETIEREWLKLSQGLTLPETKSLLNILNFIDSLLKEKIFFFQQNKNYLKLRQSYTKFS